MEQESERYLCSSSWKTDGWPRKIVGARAALCLGTWHAFSDPSRVPVILWQYFFSSKIVVADWQLSLHLYQSLSRLHLILTAHAEACYRSRERVRRQALSDCQNQRLTGNSVVPFVCTGTACIYRQSRWHGKTTVQSFFRVVLERKKAMLRCEWVDDSMFRYLSAISIPESNIIPYKYFRANDNQFRQHIWPRVILIILTYLHLHITCWRWYKEGQLYASATTATVSY